MEGEKATGKRHIPLEQYGIIPYIIKACEIGHESFGNMLNYPAMQMLLLANYGVDYEKWVSREREKVLGKNRIA